MDSLADPVLHEPHSQPSSPESTNSTSESSYTVDDITKIPYLGTAARCRTAIACDKCRERKTKCSGEKPVCKRCSSRGLICVYASRDAKRRTQSQATSARHSQSFREDGYGSMLSGSATHERTYRSSGRVEPRFQVSSQVPSKTLHYASPVHLQSFHHVYPTACPPSVGSFIGPSCDDIPSSMLHLPTSYYTPRYAPLTGSYPLVTQSDSSDSGGSSLGSAPHTPPVNSALIYSEVANPLTYSPPCPNTCYPLSYAPEHSPNYQLQYTDSQHDTSYFSTNPNSSAESLSSPSPVQSHYDHIDQSRPGPDPLQAMEFASELGVSDSHVIVGAQPSPYWPKSVGSSYPTTPTAPHPTVSLEQTE
ncbi:hypothetical protein V5O48_004881, partial [Marasmius crinis-equi]